MSTEPTTSKGLDWSPPQPTPTVGPDDATRAHPVGTAAPDAPPAEPFATPSTPSADESPLDGVIAKLPPAVAEKPEALVGVAFGSGIAAAVAIRVLVGIIK